MTKTTANLQNYPLTVLSAFFPFPRFLGNQKDALQPARLELETILKETRSYLAMLDIE